MDTVRYVAADIEGKLRMRLDALERLAPGVAAVLHKSPAEIEAYLASLTILHDFFSCGIAVSSPTE